MCGVLLFTTPDLDYAGKLVWAYVTYIMMMTVYTCINVPYGAMFGMAYGSWAFIRDNLVDPSGEWVWSLHDGLPNRSEDKAGFWKCPYHNSCMCLEIIEKLK